MLGDAAHAMAPNLGQGANSALVDGVVLAEELVGAPSVKDALLRYDKRRRPPARRLQRTADMLQRLCGLERVTALRARDALLAGLARFPRLSEGAIRQAMAAASELLGRHRCSTTARGNVTAWPAHMSRADWPRRQAPSPATLVTRICAAPS